MGNARPQVLISLRRDSGGIVRESHLRPRTVDAGLAACEDTKKREKPVRYAIATYATKQEHYDSKQASNPSRAARDGAYARTAIPKFSGGGGGSASTTRSIS